MGGQLKEDYIYLLAIITCVLIIAWLVNRLVKLSQRIEEVENSLNQSNQNLLSQKQENNSLELELKEKKLELLRFSLNPHTFRNTLHSIQYLARNTLNAVDSLTSIFDYMLYDAKQQLVPLEQEAHFAREYLNLYRIRLAPNVQLRDGIDLQALSEDGADQKVAPLLLAHFIENAFKHGDLESERAFIDVKLELLDSKTLVFSVRNRVKSIEEKTKGGLGNKSFSERLELLYPGKYHLEYNEHEGVFTANLKLELRES